MALIILILKAMKYRIVLLLILFVSTDFCASTVNTISGAEIPSANGKASIKDINGKTIGYQSDLSLSLLSCCGKTHA